MVAKRQLGQKSAEQLLPFIMKRMQPPSPFSMSIWSKHSSTGKLPAARLHSIYGAHLHAMEYKAAVQSRVRQHLPVLPSGAQLYAPSNPSPPSL